MYGPVPRYHKDISEYPMNNTEPLPSTIAPQVEIYSSSFCPFCHMALRLLDSKHVDYQLHKVDFAPSLRAQMQTRSGRTSVPQIFIGTTHVGGCDDLYALEQSGQLDALLTGKS